MATVQKTTLKRYNGTDWDPVYLANSADISYLGSGFTVAAGEGWAVGETVAASADIGALMTKAINNLTAVDKVKIPALQSGESITALAASKITGVLTRAQLPADVSGNGIEVATEEAKAALTPAQVNVGDIVKVTGGKVYLVKAKTTTAITYMELTDSASSIAWDRITGKPTTLDGYGITDAVNVDQLVGAASAANAGKILKINADGKLSADITGDAATLESHAASYFATKSEHDATATQVATNVADISELQTEIKAIDGSWITTGTIDIARLPAAAVEHLKVVADETAWQALTKSDVQNGDSVKVVSTNRMYFVADDSKLGTTDWKQAYVEYSAGRAAEVEWSGVLNKPTTLNGYGITDAVNTNQLVDTATGNAGKVLKINSNGKLSADITGDAQTLGGNAASYFATETDMAAAEANIEDLQGRMDTVENDINDTTTGLKKKVGTLETDMTTAKTDITNLKSGEAITALAASKITGTMTRAQLPADISGRLILKTNTTAMYTLTKNDVAVGDLVKLNTGDVFVVTDVDNLDSAAGYTQIVVAGGSIQVEWDNILNKPTTVAASGLTDALSDSDVVATASAANAGKLLSINLQGKLATDITGDAATLGGNAASYYAADADLDEVNNRLIVAEGDIDTLESEIKAIDGTWITTGTISIDRLPHGALERCVIVANDAARFALTKSQVQKGDTVKVTSTGLMYFVIDDDKLSSEDGYTVYTAGRASAVDWSGVENTPTTLAGYGITDAVNSSDVVTTATANKILKLNANGKLDADITGHVDWANINDKPTSTASAIDQAVADSVHTNRDVLDLLSVDTDGRLCYDGEGVAWKSELDEVALGSLKIVSELPEDASNGQLVLEQI